MNTKSRPFLHEKKLQKELEERRKDSLDYDRKNKILMTQIAWLQLNYAAIKDYYNERRMRGEAKEQRDQVAKVTPGRIRRGCGRWASAGWGLSLND